jgi:hypothetical protein
LKPPKYLPAARRAAPEIGHLTVGLLIVYDTSRLHAAQPWASFIVWLPKLGPHGFALRLSKLGSRA